MAELLSSNAHVYTWRKPSILKMKIMKTLKYSFILVALVLGSCKDLLDTNPNDTITTGLFWTTEQDAVYGANAVYTLLSENVNKATGDASHFISWDGMTDI